MSKINTGSIDADYPRMGMVNTTDQFRVNWQGSRTNLDTANTEITELQNKVLLKGPLANVTIDNNMAGTLWSNTLVSTWRHTTKNLGNDINGSITVDVSQADVQYFTVTGPVQINFTGWPAPSSGQVAVQSNVQLIVNQASGISGTQVYFPPNVIDGTKTLENYSGSGQGGYVTFPTGVNTLHYNFTSVNSGSTIEVQPLNRFRVYANAGNSTVRSVTIIGDGIGVQNATVTTSGTITLTNVGVTSVVAGTDISLSGSTGNVTVTNISALSRIPLGVPNNVGAPGDVPGVVKTDYTNLYVCVGTYDGYTPIWKRASLGTF
jgi:hypothetical protein